MRIPRSPSISIAACVFLTSVFGKAAVIINVDVSDFYDSDPLTNRIVIAATGAAPSTTVTDNGNFPQVHLKNFFASDRTGYSGELSAVSGSTLSDHLGRAYGNLYTAVYFDFSSTFAPGARDLGLLATNRLNHDFDTSEPAFLGSGSWDVAALGWDSSSFNLAGGSVEAQDFTFVGIGQYTVTIPEPSSVLLLALGGLGMAGYRRRVQS